MFVLYIISVNFFTKKSTQQVLHRPEPSKFTFFPKAKSGSITTEKAIELINQSIEK
jgi:hypothetical protein